MKIIKQPIGIPISAIRCGDIFEYEDEIYIKTDQRTKETETLEYIVAVSLSTGFAISFNPCELVEMVHGSFTVRS